MGSLLSETPITLAVLVGLLLFVASCTSPSQDGVQGRLKATLPVDGVITFE